MKMKFALVNGEREEAQPNLSGECPNCGSPTVAKCGDIRVWHWAHNGRRLCDPWWEETEWHRSWKGQFPVHWQEIVHHAEDGERHIADVETDGGWIIEFQHSYIKPDERRSREVFYQKLIWVVDILRRKGDRAQLEKTWREGTPTENPLVRRVFSDECRLVREWSGSPAPVFFDFGEEQNLAWLLRSPNGLVYIAPFSRADFIKMHRETLTKDFDSFVKEFPELIAKYESDSRGQVSMPLPPLPPTRRRRRL
jgi:hypothetical protein